MLAEAEVGSRSFAVVGTRRRAGADTGCCSSLGWTLLRSRLRAVATRRSRREVAVRRTSGRS